MHRPLKWWYGGWYSIKDFKYCCWVQDDYGDAVPVAKQGLACFYNVHWIGGYA